MIHLLSDPAAWLALLTLTALELVLGIDNIIFISILVDKLPPEQRERTRRLGLFLAMFMRVSLLLALSWIMGLTAVLFTLFGAAVTGRDLILIVGGLFLVWKATKRSTSADGGRRRQCVPGRPKYVCGRAPADYCDRCGVLPRLDHYGRWDGGSGSDHGRCRRLVRRADDALCQEHRRLRLQPPIDQNACSVVPLGGGRDADRRRVWTQGSQRLHLLRHGILFGR